MADRLLKAYWITTPDPHGPFGFGVTAHSLEDAIWIITGWGYKVPTDLRLLTIREGITVADLDDRFVIAHMGPIVVRGLWYPFFCLGVPGWMLDRQTGG